MSMKITIAIDGYSACGKSTLAKALAKALDYSFIDSGAMYRGAALFFQRLGYVSEKHIDRAAIDMAIPDLELSFKIHNAKNCLYLRDENIEDEIRQAHVANIVSKVATIKAVRIALVKQQQRMGENGGIVMDGRDIGSIVFPNAQLKLFVTADPEIRAQRRFAELQEKGIPQSLEEVKSNLTKRDHIDSTRKESPLIQVKDAIVLDNSTLTKKEQLEWVLTKAKKIIRSNHYS
ncbi:MAG: (d)CMP kinase [Crocinitomicaceae bacterium]|nr:(d)CMP kinase [Crocinitomicaceae bacterium]